MLASPKKLEDAVDLALLTLAEVAATGTNDEKIKAATALLQGVSFAYETNRKAALASRVFPLIDAVTKNLSGTLTEDDAYAPAFALEPTQQASLLASFTKQLS